MGQGNAFQPEAKQRGFRPKSPKSLQSAWMSTPLANATPCSSHRASERIHTRKTSSTSPAHSDPGGAVQKSSTPSTPLDGVAQMLRNGASEGVRCSYSTVCANPLLHHVPACSYHPLTCVIQRHPAGSDPLRLHEFLTYFLGPPRTQQLVAWCSLVPQPMSYTR